MNRKNPGVRSQNSELNSVRLVDSGAVASLRLLLASRRERLNRGVEQATLVVEEKKSIPYLKPLT